MNLKALHEINNKKWINVVVSILVLIFFVFLFYQLWQMNKKYFDDKAINLTEIIATTLDYKDLIKETPDKNLLSAPIYQINKSKLTELIKLNNNARFIYLYTLKHKELYFIMDSEDVHSKDYSAPGDIFEVNNQEYYLPFSQNQSLITKRSKDQWGEWISVLVPLCDQNNHVLAVLAIDYPSSFWLFRPIKETMIMFSLIFLAIITIVFSLSLMKKNKALNDAMMQQIKTEVQLLEEENIQKAMFENIPVGIMIIDPKTKMIESVNTHASQLIGLSREEIKGKICHSFVCPALINECPICDKNMIVDHSEKILLNMYQEQIPIIKTVKIIEINHKEKLIESFVDIRDLKATEEKLRQSEAHLRSIFELSGDGIWEWKINEKMITHNERWNKIFKEPKDLQFHSSDFFIQMIHPEDKESLLDKIEQAVRSKSSFECEHRLLISGDKTVWVYNRGFVNEINDLDQGISIIGSITDISERKLYETALQESEAKLNSLFTKSHSGIFFMMLEEAIDWEHCIDKNQQIEHVLSTQRISKVNKTFLDQYSASEKDFIHLTPKQLYANNLDQAKEMWKSLFDDSFYHYEQKENRFDGSMMWVMGDWVCLYDEKGRIVGHFGIQTDISDRKKSEELIINAKEEAERANKAKSEFLANMSHEIRTPLNAVIGFLDLLLKTSLNTVQYNYAMNSKIAGDSLLSIINDILDFSKIEAGKLELDFTFSSLSDLIEQTLDIVKYQASQKKLDLIVNYPPDLPDLVLIDFIRLRQILINLLSNAIKFTDNGEVVLKLEFFPQEEGHGQFYFLIKDTGIGIEAKNQDKLFKAFSQADSSTTKKFGGTGLGLIISSLLAKQMGSEIEFISDFGYGSTFYFSIITKYKVNKNAEVDKFLENKKIAIIDKNDKSREVIHQLLSYLGAEVMNFVDLESFFNYELTSIPDIVISYCPFENGECDDFLSSFTDKIPSLNHTSIILLHQSTEKMIHLNSNQCSYVTHLLKPIKNKEFIEVLRNIINPERILISNENHVQEIKVASMNRSISILLAEDVPLNMQLLTIRLNQMINNPVIFECHNGQDAFETFTKNKIDLILMDIQMPVMDGIDATKHIRNYEKEHHRSEETPIIALTAGVLKEEKEKCYIAGMNDFLTKPIQFDLLEEMLNKHLFKVKHQDRIASNNQTKQDDQMIHFNKNAFMKRTGNDPALLAVMMNFASSIENTIDELNQAMENMNVTLIKQLAHKLKGSSLNVSFDLLVEIAKQIEQFHEWDLSKAKDFASLLNSEWNVLKDIINSELNE